MKKHVNIRVTGKVQGVFFRASAKERADSLGVFGIVKNETDGSVYIEAEGEEGVLNLFVNWCKHGPRNAKVAACEVKPGEIKSYSSFNIQR